MVMLIGPALPWTKYADTTVTGADVPEASSWPGEPARPAGAPDLRASDADRDRVVAVIRAAVGDGRLALVEFDQRIDAALTAQTLGDLAALIADLEPGPAHPARIVPEVSEVIRIKQHGGSIIRSGRWALPRTMELRTKWCDVTLDCSAAVNPYGTLQLELKMRGGTLALLGTPGLSVDASDLAIKYTDIDLGAPAGPIDLAVHLSGSTRYGEIRVRRTTGR
jgi:hypothetical protein